MSAICPTCRKPGGIQLFTSVAPCERCEPSKLAIGGTVKIVDNTAKLPSNWTRARWVNQTRGEALSWCDRKTIETIAADDTCRNGTWGQVIDGRLSYRDPSNGNEWTIEIE